MLDGESGMGLLIELKPAAGRGQALVEAVTELVERYGFGDRAMFMSLDYPSVEALHAAHPEWWVGYCVFGTTGDIDESVWRYDIDFLAVGVFQACGLGKEAFIFAVLRKIVLEIPALFILNWIFPLYGLAYAQRIGFFVLGG